MKKTCGAINTISVSEIINTVTDQQDCTGYLGFIITYPDGKIENRILDYNRETYEQVRREIEELYCRIHDLHHLIKAQTDKQPGTAKLRCNR